MTSGRLPSQEWWELVALEKILGCAYVVGESPRGEAEPTLVDRGSSGRMRSLVVSTHVYQVDPPSWQPTHVALVLASYRGPPPQPQLEKERSTVDMPIHIRRRFHTCAAPRHSGSTPFPRTPVTISVVDHWLQDVHLLNVEEAYGIADAAPPRLFGHGRDHCIADPPLPLLFAKRGGLG